MSEVNLTFVAEPVTSTFVVDTVGMVFNPEPVTMLISTSAPSGVAAGGVGANTQVQYNNEGALGGSNSFTFNNTSNTLSVSTLAVANVTANSNVTLGTVSNVHIAGGTNGYVLQTDGSGNLSWAAPSGSGNGVVGGTNTQVQFNDAGLFSGSTEFTFDKTSNTLTVLNAVTDSLTTDVLNITGNLTIANLEVTGALDVTTSEVRIQGGFEKVTIGASAASTVNLDVLNQSILYFGSNTAGNVTLNIRGNVVTSLNSIMNTGESVTVAVVNKLGTTPYIINTVQIDTANITPVWASGSSPSVGLLLSNSFTSYTFTIIKTASSTYTVLGSLVEFK